MKLTITFLFFFSMNLHAQVKQQWLSSFNGTTQYNTMKVDRTGNIYVAGVSNSNFRVTKYNSSGVELWSAVYDSALSVETPTALVVNEAGDVYITGSTYSNTFRGYLTIKYSSSGVREWYKYYTDQPAYRKTAYGIALDVSGNVYITGQATEATSSSATTIKYNSAGVEQWVAKYYGPGNSSIGSAIVVGIDGSVFITGESVGGVGLFDYATIKYNSSGAQQWVTRYEGGTRTNNESYCIALDALGNVFVSGYSFGVGSASDYVTIKYNSGGVQQWEARYNNTGSDVLKAMTLDVLGNVYVTGYSEGTNNSGWDFVTLKYNNSGDQQWLARYNGPANNTDIGYAIAVDNDANVFVTGTSTGIGTNADFTTIKYNTSGIQQWLIRYTSKGSFTDAALSIGLDMFTNVYVGGNGSQVFGVKIIKYVQTVGVNTISSEIPSNFILLQNFPNPFNPSTSIQFDIPKTSFVSLKIYDVSGKEMQTIVSEYKSPGKYSVTYDASEIGSGIYFYKIEADNFILTKKMIVLK